MKGRILFVFLLFHFFTVFSQENKQQKKWLRIGVVYGFSSQERFIRQDSDYFYESNIFKISSQLQLRKKNRHTWELLIEPSYYQSKHESLNYWHEFYTSSDIADELRARFMVLKPINEYVLNLGLIYRYYLKEDWSCYALGNVGPMYIDTETERLKKGFAFSDIFALGTNLKLNRISLDGRVMIRHVSNANIQMPNYGFNAFGFEFGVFYELD